MFAMDPRSDYVLVPLMAQIQLDWLQARSGFLIARSAVSNGVFSGRNVLRSINRNSVFVLSIVHIHVGEKHH